MVEENKKMLKVENEVVKKPTASFSTLSIFLFSSTTPCSPFHHRARNNSPKTPDKWAET